MTNISAVLQDWAQVQPQALAIIDPRPKQTLSFAVLEESVGRAVALLRQSGLKMGDGVLIFQPMSAQLYVALLAVFRLGMVAIFVDPASGREHLERCCALYPPQALIASDKAHWLRVRSPSLRKIPVKFVIGLPVPGATQWSKAKRLQSDTAIAPCSLDTPALLTFTSGSTGQPKAALRSHGFLLAQHRALAKSLHLKPGTTDLTTLPIFVLANLASGVTSLIPDADLRFPGKIKPDRVISQIQRHQPATTAASPAFLARLVEYCENHRLQLSGLQKIFSGGAPVFPRLLKQLQDLAPQAEVSAVYGSTEAEPIAHIAYRQIQPNDFSAMVNGKGLLVGFPVSDIQLRILPYQWGQAVEFSSNEEFFAACLSAGEIGEIAVSGDHVLTSYLYGKGNEETKFQVEGTSWHRTGDAGYLDAQGRLWLMGRCSARIKDSLGQIFPFAVEAAASCCEGVHRTAAVAHQGKRILVIELEPSAPDGVLNDLKNSLAWAQIQDYRVCQHIPVDKRHNAKVDYPALYLLLEQDIAVAK